MIIDYVTGMMSAWFNVELPSKKAFFDIAKRVSYLGLMCVGMGGVTCSFTEDFTQSWLILDTLYFFGLLGANWLVINELISVLENLGATGVQLRSLLTIL